MTVATPSKIVTLTAIACRGWDERNMPAYLKRIGWTTDGEQHWCDECTKINNY